MRLPLKRYLALLATYLQPQWRLALLLALLLIADATLQLVNPQILRSFIDTALAGGAVSSLLLMAALFIGLALLGQGTTVMMSYFSEYIAWTATNHLRTDLVAHCLTLDMSFHKTRTAGEMIQRIDSDVDTLSNFFSQFVLSLLFSAIMTLAILVLFFTVDWRVGIAMLLFAISTFAILSYLRRRGLPLQLMQRQMKASFFGFLSEYLAGTEDLRANGATPYVMRQFYLLLHRWFPISKNAQWAINTVTITALFLFVFANTLAVGIGIYLWSIHQASVGTVYLLSSYTMLLSGPLRQLQRQLQDLQQADASIHRIQELRNMHSQLPEDKGIQLAQGPLSVTFHNVSFSYTSDTSVLDKLSLHITSGKVLGILGRTGSGKTTLARLLFRLYDPQAGEIRVGDVPLKDAALSDLRQRVGMVTQDVQLFHATVRDNLTFFNRAITDARILEAIHTVGLSVWYELLPNGLDSMLASGGQGLSAGEAQLLAFTRILLTNPGLVILDEASSRLDRATETLLEQATGKLFQGRTALVIAHRLTTVQRADDILILDDGHILEYGNRSELANNPHSHFAHLLQTGLEGVGANLSRPPVDTIEI